MGLIAHEQRVDLIGDAASPRSWRSLPAEPDDVVRELRRHALECQGPLQVHSLGVDSALIERLERCEAVESSHRLDADDTVNECAVRQAHAVAIDGRHPPLDLRRDALAPPQRLHAVRRPLVAACVALALLVISLSGALHWRAHQWQALADQAHERQIEHYTRLFPGRDVPRAILAELRSEAASLRGMSGASEALPQRGSALHLLVAALQRLPEDQRFRLLELRVDEQRIYLDGETRSHSGADALAAGLRRGRIFEIDAPRTEGLRERGVSFTLSGTPQNLAPDPTEASQ